MAQKTPKELDTGSGQTKLPLKVEQTEQENP